MKSIEKYEEYKKENPEYIVLIKEGSFYKTYKDDAYIIWEIFGYKWHNDSISFGISPSFKVFDTLKNKNIGYVMVDTSVITIKGDIEVYNLYKEISTINFKKNEKKKVVHDLLEKVLLNNYDKIDEITEYLNKYS